MLLFRSALALPLLLAQQAVTPVALARRATESVALLGVCVELTALALTVGSILLGCTFWLLLVFGVVNSRALGAHIMSSVGCCRLLRMGG